VAASWRKKGFAAQAQRDGGLVRVHGAIL